jgi:hypothetical protein
MIVSNSNVMYASIHACTCTYIIYAHMFVKMLSQQEIKMAFRNLARKFHPDVSELPDAEVRLHDMCVCMYVCVYVCVCVCVCLSSWVDGWVYVREK